MHRQAEHAARYAFGHWEASRPLPQVREHGLKVQRHGVMHRRRNAARLEPRFDLRAIFDFDRVLRVDARTVRRDVRRRNRLLAVIAAVERVPNQLAIASADAAARLYFLVEDFHLRKEHGGLEGIEPAVDANARMMVATILAVHADLAHHFRELIIVREERTAVAIRAERLGRKERGRSHIRQRARPASVVERTEALRAILDDRQRVPLRDFVDRVERRALPI